MKLPELNYATPHQFTRKQRIQLAILPPIAVNLLKAILKTCRHEVRDQHHFDDAIARHGRLIVAVWHESISYALYLHRGSNFHGASSFSFDGELAARLTRGFQVECLRGSTSRGGVKLLRELEKALGLVECVGLTMDGPRGPRRRAHPGLAILSAKTGVPVIPLAFAVSRSWRLRTWDRMAIPKPFGRVIIGYGAPILPAERVEKGLIEAKRQEIQDGLNALHQAYEAELGDVQHELLDTVQDPDDDQDSAP